ncbi:MAG: hypothetical protein QXU20_01760 [Candidatus Woesearchaeota archaeon]
MVIKANKKEKERKLKIIKPKKEKKELILMLLFFILLLQILTFSYLTIIKQKIENQNKANINLDEKFYKTINLLIDSESKLSSAIIKNDLPLNENFEDMYIMIFDDKNTTNFKIYSISYIKMNYDFGLFINSKINNENFFIAYCPEIDLVEVYNSNFKNEILDFKVAKTHTIYKTGISCKNAIDNYGREFDILNGILIKDGTKLKTKPFKILGPQLAQNIMKEYGVRANV